MKTKKITAILAACLAAVLLLGACNSGNTNTGAGSTAPAGANAGENPQPAADSRTLTVGYVEAAWDFDPVTPSSHNLGVPLVYDTIIRFDIEKNEFLPNLATSFGFVDNLTYALEIREGVYFSNGELLTPEDVLYSMKRFTLVPTTGDSGWDNIDYDACTINGNTLTLKLIQVDPDLPYKLSHDCFSSVICKSYVDSTGPEAFWDQPVGTGPYSVKENVAASHTTLERRDNYWGDMPEADTITIRYYSERNTMMVDFEVGVLDIAVDIGETEYSRVMSGSYGDAVANQVAASDILLVHLPQYIEAWHDVRLRQAAMYALDVESIAKAVLGDVGTVSDSLFPHNVEYYVPVGVNEYNPEKAKAILAEAGYSPEELEFLMLFPSFPMNDMAGTIVQAQLAEVGIKLNVESGDFATVVPRLMNNECEYSLGGIVGGKNTPSTVLAQVFGGAANAAARISDQEFNDYVLEGNTSIDPAVRAEAYKKAQQWIADNHWCVPIAFYSAAFAYHSNIDNIHGLCAWSIRLRDVTFN